MTTQTNTEPLKVGEECREAFEHEFSGLHPMHRSSAFPDEYMDTFTQGMWIAYKSAWNHRTEPSPAEVGSELPPPDTHCWDDDTQKDCWSYSADLVQSIVRQALSQQLPAASLESKDDESPATVDARLGAYVKEFAAKHGWEKDSGEGAFEFIQRKSYAQGLEDARAPATIEGELTDALRYEISDIIESLRDYKLDQAQAEQAIFRAIERALNQHSNIPVAAVKEGEAVAWRPVFNIPSDFTTGKPSQETIDYWADQGVEIEYAYTHPVSDDQQAKDAARYRWLRSVGHEQVSVLGHYAGEAMDHAIDAALSATKQEEV